MGQRSDEIDRRVDTYTTDDAAGNDETAEIRADIEHTRAEMSETIEALQERLSPSNLKEQAQEQFHDISQQVRDQMREQFDEAKQAVRDATIGRVENMMQSAGDTVYETRATITDTIRQNPIPAALVGIGLGWLFMNRSSTPTRVSGRGSTRGSRTYDGSQRSLDDYRVRYDDRRGYGDRDRYYDDRYADRQYSSGRYEDRGRYEDQSSGGMIERAQGVASNVSDKASNVASSVSETASNVASTVSETASNVVDRAQYGAQRVEDRVSDALHNNPLAVGAVALAIGAAVGLALPQTERENQLMGEARDNLIDRAQEVASDTFEKVQNVASEVADDTKQTVKEQAREQGLTS